MSPERIFDLLTHLQPFQIWVEMKTKVQNWTKMSICHRTVSHKKIWNVPLDALICPLQIINDIEPLSLTLHGLNACFIHHPSSVENYSIGHKSETDWPKQKQKKCILENIFLHLYACFGVKIQNTNGRKSSCKGITTPSVKRSGSISGSGRGRSIGMYVMLPLMLENGSGTHFQAAQYIPMDLPLPLTLPLRLTLGVVMP